MGVDLGGILRQVWHKILWPERPPRGQSTIDRFLDRQKDRLRDRFNGLACKVLPNGLTAHVRVDPEAEVSALRIRVGAGSSSDLPGRDGTAHLLEHLMFYGQEDPDFKRMMDEFELRGGECLGATSRNDTCYTFTVPRTPENESLMQALAARMVFSPVFSRRQAVIERDKVVPGELEFHKDNMQENIGHAAVCFAFGYGLPLEHLNLGTDGSLRSISLEDMEGFHYRHYVPANVTVEARGCTSFSGFFKDLKKNFGPLRQREEAPVERETILEYKGGYLHTGRHSHQTQIVAGFKMPDSDKNGSPVAAKVLERYLFLSLQDAFRGDQDRFLYFCNTGEGFGDLMIMQANIAPAEAARVLPVFSQILSDIALGKIDERRFKTAVAQERKAKGADRDGQRRDPQFSGVVGKLREEKQQQDYEFSTLMPNSMTVLVRDHMLAKPPTLVVSGDAANMQPYEEFKTGLERVKSQAGLFSPENPAYPVAKP